MTQRSSLYFPANRYFAPETATNEIALSIYETVKDLPLICPHGHVSPRLFSDPDYSFGTPTQLLLIPDHYIFRMLYSQGVALEELGIPRRDGEPVEEDHRKIWQRFGEHYYLFAGTPTGMWLNHELHGLFEVREKLNGESAQAIYDQIAEKMVLPEFQPRRLYERFNIEVLCTTDAATDTLDEHLAIRDSGWQGRIYPTFRPDAVVNMDSQGWREAIDLLSERSGVEARDYVSFIRAIEQRRAFFKEMGAHATDHAALSAYTTSLSVPEADEIFRRALKGSATEEEARRFTGHMLIENARMSTEDGLVMQLHPGSYRNHNDLISRRFGPDMGADIPVATEYTRNLQPLLNRFGNHPNLTLILFTLDESTYSRELAPLAGHYPAVKLGPPWWFNDSWNGMSRFREQVSETAGLYNTVGFNDDTRAFPSIPARHDLARRVDANWLAGLVGRGVIDRDDATTMAYAAAYGLAKQAYRFDKL